MHLDMGVPSPRACAMETEQVWSIGVAEKTTRFLPFIALVKRFNAKFRLFGAIFNIVIVLIAHKYL